MKLRRTNPGCSLCHPQYEMKKLAISASNVPKISGFSHTGSCRAVSSRFTEGQNPAWPHVPKPLELRYHSVVVYNWQCNGYAGFGPSALQGFLKHRARCLTWGSSRYISSEFLTSILLMDEILHHV